MTRQTHPGLNASEVAGSMPATCQFPELLADHPSIISTQCLGGATSSRRDPPRAALYMDQSFLGHRSPRPPDHDLPAGQTPCHRHRVAWTQPVESGLLHRGSISVAALGGLGGRSRDTLDSGG